MTDEALAGAAARLRPASARRSAWHDDPVRFATECLRWPTGESLAPYQADVLAALVADRRVAVRSLRGAGKSTTTALAVLWHAVTRESAGVDWKTLTTAGSWRQLERFLWREVHKWAWRIRWDVVGRAPFDARNELTAHTLKLRYGQAFAAASDDPALLEGAHAESLLVVIDESKSVAASAFDALEGAMSSGECFALATSTPGPPSGRFFEIFERRPGLLDWRPLKVGLPEALAAGRVSQEWVDARAEQWGRASPLFVNQCLGDFAATDADSVIPLPWIEAAVERWQAWADAGRSRGDEAVVLGVDVARGGRDKTVTASRYGDIVERLDRFDLADTMAVTGHVLAKVGRGTAVVDVIGVGAGVVDRLREQRVNVIAFLASGRSVAKDRSGEMGFQNVRSEAWWRLRENLDPAFNPTFALPDDPELIGDLCAPSWRVDSSGRIAIESKDDIRKRLGRSTDAGDAVVMSLGPGRKKRRRRMVAAGRLPPVRPVGTSATPYRDDPMVVQPLRRPWP